MVSVYSGVGSQEAAVIALELKKRSRCCCSEASPLRMRCCRAVEADAAIEAAAEVAGFVDEYFVAAETVTAKVG